MLINIYLGTTGWKWSGDEFHASEHFLMTSNFFSINIYLGTIGWKWTGDELQASEHFLMTSNIFF